jgi:hypothetical protein
MGQTAGRGRAPCQRGIFFFDQLRALKAWIPEARHCERLLIIKGAIVDLNQILSGHLENMTLHV